MFKKDLGYYCSEYVGAEHQAVRDDDDGRK